MDIAKQPFDDLFLIDEECGDSKFSLMLNKDLLLRMRQTYDGDECEDVVEFELTPAMSRVFAEALLKFTRRVEAAAGREAVILKTIVTVKGDDPIVYTNKFDEAPECTRPLLESGVLFAYGWCPDDSPGVSYQHEWSDTGQ